MPLTKSAIATKIRSLSLFISSYFRCERFGNITTEAAISSTAIEISRLVPRPVLANVGLATVVFEAGTTRALVEVAIGTVGPIGSLI